MYINIDEIYKDDDKTSKIKDLAKRFNTSEQLIKATIADGYELDVIADQLANGKDLLQLEECSRSARNRANFEIQSENTQDMSTYERHRVNAINQVKIVNDTDCPIVIVKLLDKDAYEIIKILE